MLEDCRSIDLSGLATALLSVLAHGYLPQLQRVICVPNADDEKLVTLAEVLKGCHDRPGLQMIPAETLGMAAVDRLRAVVDGIPAPGASSAKPKGKAKGGGRRAGAQGQWAGATLDDEGRNLLLQHLLC